MRAKKSLGQNFLMHPQTAQRIRDAAHLSKNDIVLEIGPGTGMLTKPLLAVAKKVIALEADHELVKKLHETFAFEIEHKKLELIETDVRAFDPSSLQEPYTLVANIPYYLTGEIIRKFLSATHKPRSMTLLVQKEVAERITRSKKESLLSISVKIYGTPEYEFTIPRGAFIPAPSVDSALISIRDIQNPFDSEHAERHFFDAVRAGFSAKRKRLAKNLEAIAPKEVISEAFESLSLSQNIRAEDISCDTWKKLVAALHFS